MTDILNRSACPISYCLDFLGDKWSLLIIRDMILDGKTTYGDFLDSEEQIATNILASRLKSLEAEGFIVKYPLEGKSRAGYCLTKKGIDLIPVITEMALWGTKYSTNNSKKELLNALRKDKNSVIKGLIDTQTKRFKAIQKIL